MENNQTQENMNRDFIETEETPKVEEKASTKTKPLYRAELVEDYNSPNSSNEKFNYVFSMPSIPLRTLNTQLTKFNNLNIDPNSPEIKKWQSVVEESVNFYTPRGLYQERFQDDTSLFKQGIETKEANLKSISSVKFKKYEGELKGEEAILKISRMLGLGDVVTVPLPHSGIVVTIKPPTEKDLIDFYNNLFKDKIALGRATAGLTFTSFSVYVNNMLFDFIIKHIHSVNYGDINKNDLKNYVLLHDFPILAWGFATSIYPNGFDYQRACINNLEECSYIARATINLTKLLWVDNPMLTEYQKDILTEFKPGKFNIENYRRYIAEHRRTKDSLVTINDSIKLKLKIPTFVEFTADGFRWVNGINNKIDSLIVESENEEEAKSQALEQYVKATLLRQFSHFIEYIETDENVISDRDTINEILEIFSSDDEIRNKITDEILKFKSNTTIAIIGIPEYKCPNCGKAQNVDPVNDRFVNVIPLDVLQLFFSLITLRISKILAREI